MRATLSPTLACLASFSFLGLTSAFVIPGTDRINLENAPCQNIRLEDKYVLRMDSCTGYRWPDEHGDLSLDLNDCLANYRGTLNRVDSNGGFGSSCPDCKFGEHYKLECQCNTGNGNETMATSFDLNYWRNVRIESNLGRGFTITCGHDDGIDEEWDSW